ncbi:hypothetical protein [Xanthomonas vesicatoria]|uniref:hypothetical protein n=1 Tax=Xanthomonas vesicatoria TaxID=56460 RepID=UPI000731F250|nr:hypothetical protein [Xanthomonas vesicatoria]KTF37966.1 hypothetical protein LMG919_05170 [Xanthomonas vesicatoria]MCC8559256.1 hypothetical protein [Xanthomonas vesicatoria]MCC8601129.1 hypothetical protein [Xanthomonas vesicatoria]MCC8608348.1 hypothetical protein [Xanthomonas vesicatoria]MCC8673772.1 hypothetical protein [Xanthomonas vesicatoria]
MPDPGYLARMFAQMKAMGGPDLPGARPGQRTHLSLAARRVRTDSLSRTKLEMREEHGLRANSLDGLLAGRIETSRSWRLALRSLLGKGLRCFFSENAGRLASICYRLIL